MNKMPKKLLCFMLTLFFSLILANLSIAESLSLGNMSYGQINTPYLARTVSRSASFARAVGGVAFEAVAVGDNGLKVIKLSYNSLAQDGSRLIITMIDTSGKKYEVVDNIYDWQLIPIARFANSSNGAAMTLFGDASDKKIGDEILEAGGRIINYHAALQDTLVGLRLFQADILIFQENGADLFRDKSGKYILGAGEGKHNLAANQARFKKMRQLLDDEAVGGSKYESYVVGDLGRKITFGILDNKYYLKGEPYWWMWRTPGEYRIDRDQFQIDMMVLQALSVVNSKSTGKEEFSQSELEKSQVIISAFEEASGDYDALAQRLDKYKRINSIKTLPVEQNVDLSNKTSSKVAELEGINPIVYENLRAVMLYSALFRHAKKVDAVGYSKFVDSMRSTNVLPKVVTPTVQYGVVH